MTLTSCKNGNIVYCDTVPCWSGLVLSPKHLDTVRWNLTFFDSEALNFTFYFIFRKHFQCTFKSKKNLKSSKPLCLNVTQSDKKIVCLFVHKKNVAWKGMRFGIELKMWWCSALMCHRPFKQTPTHTGLSSTKAASTLGAGAVPGKNPHMAAEAATEGCLRWDKNTGEARGKRAI